MQRKILTLIALLAVIAAAPAAARSLDEILKDGWFALAGNPYSPPSQWGLSSAKIFRPWIGLPT